MTGRDQPPLHDPPRIQPSRLGGLPRWVVHAGRGLLWALLAALVVLGIVGILRTGGADRVPDDPAAGWPTRAASVLALEETDRWLSSGGGTGAPVEVDGLSVADHEVHDSGRATVTVAVRLVGEPGRWLHVAVPVYRDGGQVGLAGTPALMAVPPAAEPLQARFGDVAVPDEVTEAVEGWAGAFAEGGSALSRWMTAADPVTGLGGRVALDEVTSVQVLDEPEDGVVTVLAGVRWLVLPGSAPGQDVDVDGVDGPRISQTYRLRLTEDDGRWYVDRITVGYPDPDSESTEE